MKEFTVFKPGSFTVMPNTHLMNKSLSLKAVGLLSKMLNLPENWDYSLKGLVVINKENYDTIRSILNELKDHNYIGTNQCGRITCPKCNKIFTRFINKCDQCGTIIKLETKKCKYCKKYVRYIF